MSDEANMNELLQAIHDAEQTGEPATGQGLAYELGEDWPSFGTRVFGALNSGYAEQDDEKRLTLTESGRREIGVDQDG